MRDAKIMLFASVILNDILNSLSTVNRIYHHGLIHFWRDKIFCGSCLAFNLRVVYWRSWDDLCIVFVMRTRDFLRCKGFVIVSLYWYSFLKANNFSLRDCLLEFCQFIYAMYLAKCYIHYELYYIGSYSFILLNKNILPIKRCVGPIFFYYLRRFYKRHYSLVLIKIDQLWCLRKNMYNIHSWIGLQRNLLSNTLCLNFESWFYLRLFNDENI